MKLKTFDVADYLDNEEMIAAYLAEAATSGDPALIRAAHRAVARARARRDTQPKS